MAGDSADVAVFRPLLAQTQLEAKPLRLAYDATRHGWAAATLHRGVNTFGACVVVARTVGGAVVGGYNPKGWIGLGEEDRPSMAAFLFCWPDGDTSRSAIKLPKVRQLLAWGCALPCQCAHHRPSLPLSAAGWGA